MMMCWNVKIKYTMIAIKGNEVITMLPSEIEQNINARFDTEAIEKTLGLIARMVCDSTVNFNYTFLVDKIYCKLTDKKGNFY